MLTSTSVWSCGLAIKYQQFLKKKTRIIVVAKAPTGGELILAVHSRSFLNALIQASAREQGETDVVPVELTSP